MFTRRRYEIYVIPFLVAAGVAFASVRHRVQLRPEMPPSFAGTQDWAGKGSESDEQEIARLYWECALNVVQPELGYKTALPLPRDPPPDFRVDATGPNARRITAARTIYWNRLREMWFQQSTWLDGYEWDFSWVSDPIAAAGGWLQRMVGRIGAV